MTRQDASLSAARVAAYAVTEAGATLCEVISHRFTPQGVTVLAMLAESHASVHTYPELGAVFVDVFTCGDEADPVRAVDPRCPRQGPGTDHTRSRCHR